MKQKKYTEEEIFKIIDEFPNYKNDRGWTAKIKRELNQRFMTPQGFRKAIEKAGLKGEKFD